MARLKGSFNADTITGYATNDRISGGYGNDALAGGGGNDRLAGGRGSDTLSGGDGNDIIVSRSDGGEGAITQAVTAANDPNGEVNQATRMIYPGQAGLPADDVLTGGAGADLFRFDLLVNAKQAIIKKHTDPNTGVIDWAGVTGENNLVHDHWVDGVGNDVITDFNKGQGDRIAITGHTTEVYRIDIVDADGDGQVDDTVLNLRSNQGGAGAHDKDRLGTITVLDNQLTADDFTVDATSTAGIVRNISQINEAISPYNPGGGTPAGGANPTDDVTVDTGSGTAHGHGGASTGGTAGAGNDGVTSTGAATGNASGGAVGGGMAAGGDAAADAASGNDRGNDAGTATGGSGSVTGTGTGSAAANPLSEFLTAPAGTVAGQAVTSGDDNLVGTSSVDRINGSMGNDLLLGLDGNDNLSGGWGDDRIDGGAGDDHIHGGNGNDLVAGGDGNDGLTGDNGDDILLGQAGDDRISGGRGDDVVFGGDGADDLNGGSGNDILIGGAGSDRINGGSGIDAALYGGAIGDYTVAINGNTVSITDAAGSTDTVRNVEQFRFTGTGETYVIENGALALTTDTEDLDDLLHDHMLEDLVASELATADTAPAAGPANAGMAAGAGGAAASAGTAAADATAAMPEADGHGHAANALLVA